MGSSGELEVGASEKYSSSAELISSSESMNADSSTEVVSFCDD